MKYKIDIPRNWRPDRKFVTPGVYRVPEDISDDMAQRAMAEVGAKVVEPPNPGLTFRKGPAPENKRVEPLSVGYKPLDVFSGDPSDVDDVSRGSDGSIADEGSRGRGSRSKRSGGE